MEFTLLKHNIMCKLIVISIFVLMVHPFKPLTKEEHLERIDRMNEHVEPLRRNLTECGTQVKASMTEVELFLNRQPQTTMPGKCLVACMLRRTGIIRTNFVERDFLIQTNVAVFGNTSEVVRRLETAIDECVKLVDDIFEICEMASTFNDCMHVRMEHVLDKIFMERRMENLGQFGEEIGEDIDEEEYEDIEDEAIKLFKDEL